MQPERATVRRFHPPPREFKIASRPLSVQEFMAAVEQFKQVTPAQVYAIQKTGKIITGDNAHSFPQADKDAFVAAVKEFRMPTKQVVEVFQQNHENLRGADPENIISAALSYAVDVALKTRMSNAEFVEILQDVSAQVALINLVELGKKNE
jgi:hypothetical protein